MFDEGAKQRSWGEVAGFSFSYALFTTILFGVLSFTGHLPGGWGLLNVAGITLALVALGEGLRRFLA